MTRLARLLPAVLLLGAAPADPFACRIQGAPKDCIDPSEQSQVAVLDARTIAYSGTPRRLWRNTLDQACPGLVAGGTFVVEQRGGRLCARDRVRPVRAGIGLVGSICRLGDFVPYELPPKR